MIYPRTALSDLKSWASSSTRKPLLLRGPRQVGKSTLVRLFGEEFDHFIDFNLEVFSNQQVFRKEPSIEQIFDQILVKTGISSLEGSCLLFLDEIQESPEAIFRLRYFYEKMPHIHVIAAGSLLEFSFGEVKSMPVGRISYYYLYPLTFEEYLRWVGQAIIADRLNEVPLPKFMQDLVFTEFHNYILVGGMPEVVKTFARTKRFSEVSPVYESIWRTYTEDIPKYIENRADRKVTRYVLEMAPTVRDRIKFAGFGGSDYTAKAVKSALFNLELAGILRLLLPSSNVEIPILPDLKRRPRIQFIDTGLLNHLSGVQSELSRYDDFMDYERGYVIQHMLTQEMIALDSMRDDLKPKFWVRETSGTSAEVDLLYQHGKYVIPVEIKSGAQGRLRSLHQFIDRAPHPYAIRFLKNNFSVEKHKTISGTPYFLMNLPYFLMGQIR